MKKINIFSKFAMFVAVAAISAIMLSACKKTETIKVADIYMNQITLSLITGTTEQLMATILPNDATDKSVTWASGDTNVATVDTDGKVLAVAAGETVITVTTKDGGKTTTCRVMVTAAVITTVSGTTGLLAWTLYSDGKLVISGNGDMPDYTYNEHSPWSNYSAEIKTVVIENGVISIGSFAFFNCSLTSVTIPNSVISIGGNAFSRTYLTSVTIPNSCTTIGAATFNNCSELVSVTLPNSVTIGNFAFSYCTSLITIDIGSDVSFVNSGYGEYGFHFEYCKSLTSINVDANNPNYSSQDGVLFNKDKTELYQYPGGKQGVYIIPNTVNTLFISAFSQCVGLTSVTIPNSVTTITSSAFSYCLNLTSVIIGNSVANIEKYAFRNCPNLTSITIPASVTFIGNWAFQNCTRLTSITCRAVTPPAIEDLSGQNGGAFVMVDKSIPVKVPIQSITIYQQTAFWNEFTNIMAE